MEPFDTLVVHGAVESDPLHHAVNVPIYQTSTYELEDVAQFPEFAYSRVSNPTRKAVEAQIAAMEDRRGTPAVVGEKRGKLRLKIGIVSITDEGFVDFVQHFFQGFGNELSAVGAEETGFKSLGADAAGFGNAHV